MTQRETFLRLMEYAPGGIFYTDAGGCCLFVSSDASELFSLSQELCLGASWVEYIDENVREDVATVWQSALNLKQRFDTQFPHVDKSGQVKRLRVQANPIVEHSEHIGYIGSVVDITETYEVQDHLNQTEFRFTRLFDSAEVAIWDEDFRDVFVDLERIRASGVTDLSSFFDDNPEYVLELAKKVRVSHVNQVGLSLFEASSEHEFLIQIDRTFGESSLIVFREELMAMWRGDDSFKAEAEFRTLKGKSLTAILSMPIPTSKEEALSVPVSIFDITERAALVSELKETISQLRESEERFELAVRGSGVGIWDWNIDTDEVYYSDRFKEILGYQPDELPNTYDSFRRALHVSDVDEVRKAIHAHFKNPAIPYDIEYRLKSKRGEYCWVRALGEAVRDDAGRPCRMAGSMIDITDKKLAEHLIWQQANYDSLTALPNRVMFLDRFEQEIIKGKRSGVSCALLFIDLDHFKHINDTLGHKTGDMLLVEAAMRLLTVIRESDTVARFGGDEFVVMLTNITSSQSVERVASAIVDAFSAPFYFGGEVAFVSASIGISMFPEDGGDVDELFRFADQAMYEAKHGGRNRYSFFTQCMQDLATRQRKLTNDLRVALECEQLELVYQSIVDMRTGKVHKAEALLRWYHPKFGNVSPSEFIPLAEDSGLIVEIGEWVFKQAAFQVKEWREKIHPDFQLSINISPIQFQHDKSQDWIDSLKEQGVDGDAINIEITEGLLLESDESVKLQIDRFHQNGMYVALDDFGTGYSSLSYLKKFDIDYLKIDQAFVNNMEEGSEEHALCEAIIVMAHKLSIFVVAEGIETESQKALLIAAGCDFGQGYYFSKPIRADEFSDVFIGENKCA